MKVFVIALAALAVVTVGVFSASLYVTDTMDKLSDMALSLPPVGAEDIWEELLSASADIESFWSSRSRAVSLSVSHKETEMIDLAVKKMLSAARLCDSGDFSSALAELLHRADCLRDSERLSLNGIL